MSFVSFDLYTRNSSNLLSVLGLNSLTWQANIYPTLELTMLASYHSVWICQFTCQTLSIRELIHVRSGIPAGFPVLTSVTFHWDRYISKHYQSLFVWLLSLLSMLFHNLSVLLLQKIHAGLQSCEVVNLSSWVTAAH